MSTESAVAEPETDCFAETVVMEKCPRCKKFVDGLNTIGIHKICTDCACALEKG